MISTDDDNQFNVRSVIIMTTTGDQFKVSFQDSWYEHVAPWPGQHLTSTWVAWENAILHAVMELDETVRQLRSSINSLEGDLA